MPSITEILPNLQGRFIDNDSLMLLDMIGSGAYGAVYRAIETRSPTPRQFAVKVLLRYDPEHHITEYQTHEVNMHWRASSHPNVVTLDRVVKCDEYFIFVVMDLCTSGDLLDAVTDRQVYYRNDGNVKRAFTQLIDALQYCHEKSIYHRDLKPDNVLCSPDGSQVYLTDFGLATSHNWVDCWGTGTSSFMSPQCCGQDPSSLKFDARLADIWALGIILLNMLTSHSPWEAPTFDDPSFAKFLVDPDYLVKVLPISREANRLVRRILTFQPHLRISLMELRREVGRISTFFMTAAELAKAPRDARIAAKDCVRLKRRNKYMDMDAPGIVSPSPGPPMNVELPHLTIEDSDESDESGAVTPETLPADFDVEDCDALFGGLMLESLSVRIPEAYNHREGDCPLRLVGEEGIYN